MFVDAKWITGEIAGYSGQTWLLMTWIGLWSGQIGFINIIYIVQTNIVQTVIILLIL